MIIAGAPAFSMSDSGGEMGADLRLSAGSIARRSGKTQLYWVGLPGESRDR